MTDVGRRVRATSTSASVTAVASARRPETPVTGDDEQARRAVPRWLLQFAQSALNCTDGFMAAFWGRPEAYLDPRIRSATSPWDRLAPETVGHALDHLVRDLAGGEWDHRHRQLRRQHSMPGMLLIAATDRELFTADGAYQLCCGIGPVEAAPATARSLAEGSYLAGPSAGHRDRQG